MRRLPLALAAFVTGCATPSASVDDTGAGAGGDTADTAADTAADTGDTADTAADTGDTADTAADAAWPPSSVCLGTTSSTWCEQGMSADDWAGAHTWTWVLDPDFGASTVSRDGAALFSVSCDRWLEISGLAVSRTGDLYLAGGTTGPSTLTVNGNRVAFTNTYPRFLVRVTPEGDVVWGREFAGISVESLSVAPTADDGAVVVGELSWVDTTIGSIPVTGGEWLSTTLAAGIDAGGTWQWALTTPSSAQPPGEFNYGSIEASGSTDIWVHGFVRGDLTVGASSLSCSTSTGCPATVVLAPDGTLVDLLAG